MSLLPLAILALWPIVDDLRVGTRPTNPEPGLVI